MGPIVSPRQKGTSAHQPGSGLHGRGCEKRRPPETAAALVPTTVPANAPAIDELADRYGLEQPQELGLNLHGNLCMALPDAAVKAIVGQPDSIYSGAYNLKSTPFHCLCGRLAKQHLDFL
jgi:hypothetical protein